MNPNREELFLAHARAPSEHNQIQSSNVLQVTAVEDGEMAPAMADGCRHDQVVAARHPSRRFQFGPNPRVCPRDFISVWDDREGREDRFQISLSSRAVLGVFKPGQHGSTFGGNPLACAVGREVIAMLATGEYQERSAKLGTHLHDRLSALPRDEVAQVRGRGLWAGVEFTRLGGREACERLAARGVLAKDTHGTTIRLAPPLTISEPDLDWALDQIADAIG